MFLLIQLSTKRLQFMLEDTKAPILITQSLLEDRFGEYLGTIVLSTKMKKVSNNNQR